MIPKLINNIWHKLGPETQEQIMFMAELQIKHPKVYEHTFHIANERKTKKITGLILKCMGVKRGVSDIMIAYPHGKYPGMFIEMKAKKGRPTVEQKEFLDRMKKVGYYTCIAYGALEAYEHVAAYLQSQ